MSIKRIMRNKTEIDRRAVLLGASQGMLAASFGAHSASAADDLARSGTAGLRSKREFGVSAATNPAVNRRRLQDAIDWASVHGGGIWIEPTYEPYPIEAGLRLRMNASLVGVHGAVSRGTRHPQKKQPVGSVFRIESTEEPFFTVESSSQLRGLQFWYPAQTLSQPTKVIKYPPTIKRATDQFVGGVTLTNLAFYGEYATFDFCARPLMDGTVKPSELILFEHCYGYPLGGRFIDIDNCYDIPRILHCHVNPANCRTIASQDHSPEVTESVIDRRTFSYSINQSDNAQLIDLFTFGVFGGVRLGAETYGQLTNFNLDCVTIGIHKSGSQQRNRNWQLSQGSIIANAGSQTSELHPLVIDGQGHTSISNVESFAGKNAVINSPTTQIDGTEQILSEDFLLAGGNEPLTVSLLGCRMGDFRAKGPITLQNPLATVSAHGCFTTRGQMAPAVAFPDGIVPV